MAPKWCVICGEDRIATESTVVIDGDPMCAAHAAVVNRGAAMMAAASGKPALCSRGCGKPTHRGLCAGQHAGGRIATESTVVIDGDPMCAAHAAVVNRGAAMMAAASGKPALCSRGCGKPTHRGLCAGQHAGGRQPYKPGERQAKAEIPQPAPVVAAVCGAENASPETLEALGQLARSAAAACNARMCARCDQPVHQGHCLGVAHGPQNLSDEAKSERARKAMATRRERELLNGTALGLEVVDDDELPKLLRKGRMGMIWDALDALAERKWLKIPNRDRGHLGTTSRELRNGAAKIGATLELEPRGTFLFARHCMEQTRPAAQKQQEREP